MEENDNKDFYKQKHGINIALASQLRLHDILNRIVSLDAGYPIDSPEKQKCYLSLVKQYLISAVPYLSPNDAKRYQNEVLSFSIQRFTSVRKGNQKSSYQFSPKLDKRLNEILMELQGRLRHIFSKILDTEDDEGL